MKNRICKKLISCSLLLILFLGIVGCGEKNNDNDKKEVKDNKIVTKEETSNNSDISIAGVEDISIIELSDFDPLEGVSVKNSNDEDLTSKIELMGSVNVLKEGEYLLTYAIPSMDFSAERKITVTPIEATPVNGEYNFKFASSDIRHTFMAAAEDYLIHNQYAGVPIISDAGFNLFSGRMQLLCEKYIPIIEFGIGQSSMSADDSKVLMEDGKPGKVGEYTYRTALPENPSQWNHWEYDDDTSRVVMSHYLDGLYSFELNDDKNGYVLEPAMALGNPIPIDGKTLEGGKIISNKWQIKIRDGLKWKFNDRTDISMITKNDIVAKDFYETYKIALENKWFRAISGGGDFITSATKIKNAQEFVDGIATWEEVGIKLVDENTIEFEYINEQSEWNVKYALAGFVMGPINIELYNALGDQYGLDETSIAYTGAYYVDYYENDKIIRYLKNELFYDKDKYFYTGRTMSIIADAEMRFQEFISGKLDATKLPTAHYEDYKSHPGLKPVPGTTAYRIMINGLNTKEGQLEEFPESKWEPKPILANQDFKMALFHAIDRKKLAKEVLKTSEPQMYLFTSAYVVEPEDGIPYRTTKQGEAVGADLSPSTYGYNVDAAKAYYEKALDKLVADGIYKDGDAIEIEYYFFANSDSEEMMATYLKDAMEAAFKTDKYDISFSVNISPKEFPGIYYDHMMIGEFDTAVGGISGSTLDAASFLDTYCSDNRGGFTINWGIDTSIAEIPVVYKNESGKLVKELWSFDAISSVLNGKVEVVNGAEKVEDKEGIEEVEEN
jgi:ABC-type oligopeptide transport system substrate-binding subunit